MFTWQFFIVAYWKILAVVRRQAKVFTDRSRTTAKEPTAGTSRGTVELAVVHGSARAKNQSNEIVEAEDQTPLKFLSQAQINIVRTMIYVTVCFTLCWGLITRKSYDYLTM